MKTTTALSGIARARQTTTDLVLNQNVTGGSFQRAAIDARYRGLLELKDEMERLLS